MIRKLTMAGYAAENGIGRFICDYTSDLQDLPTQNPSDIYPEMGCVKSGSLAVVLEDGTEYMLNNQAQWRQINFNGGGGGGGGDVEIATNTETMDYIFG